jgi:hypothetical protein
MHLQQWWVAVQLPDADAAWVERKRIALLFHW